MATAFRGTLPRSPFAAARPGDSAVTAARAAAAAAAAFAGLDIRRLEPCRLQSCKEEPGSPPVLLIH